jgi:polyhydroxyalkanoate synthesis regulator phasin
VDGAAILGQAEEAMLSAVDSLNGAKFPTAIGQERDALRYLMEARNTIQIGLMKQSRAVRAQARAFDRLQRQKLRRENEKSDSLPQIAEELARLANDEDEVARTIAAGGKNKDPMAQGDSDAQGEKPGKGKPDPAAERQEEIAGAAAAVEKLAGTAKGLTGLARNRIAEAAKAANAAADALGQGDGDAARPEVDKARETFRAAAKQVAALAAEEGTQQLAAARDLANDVALKAAPPDPDRKMPLGPGLGSAAEDAKSLKDVLDNLAASGKPADADAARKAAGLLRQENLPDAIARLEKPGAGGDRAERKDLADRFAALGQKLDEAYREAVAPRLEEIARLEREANDLEQKVARAGEEDWRRLRQQGAQLLARLEEAGLDALVNDDFRAGLGNTPAGPAAFGRGVTLLHARLVAKLQEFVAGDRIAAGNESVPPQYKDLVERYLRALSAGGSK